MEGVTYALRDSLAIIEELGVPVKQIRASGGGCEEPALAADAGRRVRPESGHDQRRGRPGLWRVKNGPALAGRGAKAVRDAIAKKIQALPTQLRRSLTWDQGAELAQHAQLRIDTGLEVYFCDPQSPWQRGTNENTNGLLRQYFPKGTDISRYSARELDAVASTLNSRPRKTLGWRTPAEALNEILRRRTQTASRSASSADF